MIPSFDAEALTSRDRSSADLKSLLREVVSKNIELIQLETRFSAADATTRLNLKILQIIQKYIFGLQSFMYTLPTANSLIQRSYHSIRNISMVHICRAHAREIDLQDGWSEEKS